MLDVCVKARRAIQTIHTYLLTPLPFAYIHAVALLVDAMVAVTTIKCSLVTTKAMYQENVNFQNVMYEILAFVTLPLLYHGLLSVSVVIRDPFGDDMADFPMSTFERWERANLDAAVAGNEKFPYGEWEILSGQPQSEASKMAAAAAAYAAAKPQGAETEEDIDEDSAGVQQVADQTALAIMKEATIEVTLSTKRALKGFALELALLQEAVERSEEIRAKENVEYVAVEKELTDVVDTLERAINVLQRKMHGSALLETTVDRRDVRQLIHTLSALVDAAAFSQQDKTKLLGLVQNSNEDSADDEMTDLGAPAAEAYKGHSGSIIDTLDCGLTRGVRPFVGEITERNCDCLELL